MDAIEKIEKDFKRIAKGSKDARSFSVEMQYKWLLIRTLIELAKQLKVLAQRSV